MFIPYPGDIPHCAAPIMPLFPSEQQKGDTNPTMPPIQPQDGYRHSLELVSLLLAYPDTTLQHTLCELDRPHQCLHRIPRLDTVVATFVHTVSAMTLTQWQALYVETFDLDPLSSLHLTWHVFGDSPRQGRALAAISEVYRDAGFAPVPRELPDYLPMMLEFMAVGPEWATVCLCEKFGTTIAKLTARIDSHNSPYAPLLEHALEVLTIPLCTTEVTV